MINFTYSRARTVDSATVMIAKDPASKIIAGGTNLVDLMKRGVMAPEKLVDITGVPLRNIETHAGGIRIGALATNREVAEHPAVKKDFPLLSLALQTGASPQLRNMATTGGNMMQRTRCSYFYDTAMPCNKREPGTGCSAIGGHNRMHAIFGTSEACIAVHPSDMCVGLAALEATVIVRGNKKERSIPFINFHRLPGTTPQKDNNLERDEMITGIEIPSANYGDHVHYLKIRDRSSYAFALVSVAAALQINNGIITKARLAMGGVAHKPWRLLEAENYLAGKPVTLKAFKEAGDIAITGAKYQEHNLFKQKMTPAAIIEALKTAAKI